MGCQIFPELRARDQLTAGPGSMKGSSACPAYHPQAFWTRAGFTSFFPSLSPVSWLAEGTGTVLPQSGSAELPVPRLKLQ